MNRFNDTFDRYAFRRLFTWTPDNAIAGNQRTNSSSNVATVDLTVGGFHVGMHTETADDDAFRRLTKQVVVVIDLLRSGFKTALVIGIHAALLPFGEFIFTQSRWLLVARKGQNLYDTL